MKSALMVYEYLDMPSVIDTHAHLSDVKNVAEVLHNALENGVSAVVAVSANRRTCLETLRIAENYRELVYPALGVHPTEIEADHEETLVFIEASMDRCVAVGEAGLDFWRLRGQPGKSEEERRLQIHVYTKQLEIAERHGKPILIHSRGAWDAAYGLAESLQVRKAVFHWFTGSLEVLKSILDRGYLVSATPAVEYSKAHRSVIKETPLEMLLLETDSPVAYRGVPSEPSDVLRTLRAVAELKGISEEEVAEVTTASARRFFGLTRPRKG